VGADTATYATRYDNLTLSLNGVADDGAPGEGDNLDADIEHLTAGSGNDVLVGSPGDDSLLGGPGLDLLDGGAGADVLDGGDDDDVLAGGAGPDKLIGGPGADTASYADRTQPVQVALNGLPDDGESGEADNVQTDNVRGGQAADVLIDDPATANTLEGGLGADQLIAHGGARIADTLLCGAGDDAVSADLGDDYAADCEHVVEDGVQVRPDPPITPEPPAPVPPAPAPATFTLAQKTVTADQRRVVLNASCRLPVKGACKARIGVSLTWNGRRRGVAFLERTLVQGKRTKLSLVLPKDVFTRLRRHGSLKLALRITLVQPDGSTKTQSQSVRLRYDAPKPRR
jgi:hypothetical protein